MGIPTKLKGNEGPLTKDLEETTTSFRSLGRKYGVSRQTISNFCRKKRILRPQNRHSRPERKHIPERCPICRGLIEIARKPQSDFISSQTIKAELGIGSEKWRYHIRILRRYGLVSPRFGRLHSKKAELAYQIYFKERLPVLEIGKQAGLKNFHAVIKWHKARGWDVPDPMFTHDKKDRAIINRDHWLALMSSDEPGRADISEKTP